VDAGVNAVTEGNVACELVEFAVGIQAVEVGVHTRNTVSTLFKDRSSVSGTVRSPRATSISAGK
jgi:hypothetical protein